MTSGLAINKIKSKRKDFIVTGVGGGESVWAALNQEKIAMFNRFLLTQKSATE